MSGAADMTPAERLARLKTWYSEDFRDGAIQAVEAFNVLVAAYNLPEVERSKAVLEAEHHLGVAMGAMGQAREKLRVATNLFLEWEPKQVCARCGKPIEGVFVSRAKKYCSYRCVNDAQIARRRERQAAARQLVCAQCGDAFEGKRRDAKYCSPRCKTAAHRQRTTVVPNSDEPQNVTGKHCGEFATTGNGVTAA